MDGAGLAHRVSECVNVGLPPGQRQWSVFDQELVDRVAADLPYFGSACRDARRHSNRTWLEEFFPRHVVSRSPCRQRFDRGSQPDLNRAGFGPGGTRGSGRARCAALITHDMPGGHCIFGWLQQLQKTYRDGDALYQEPEEQAAEHVRRLDVDRIAFYRRYWPQHSLAPETFSATLNAGSLSPEQMTLCVVDLLNQ